MVGLFLQLDFHVLGAALTRARFANPLPELPQVCTMRLTQQLPDPCACASCTSNCLENSLDPTALTQAEQVTLKTILKVIDDFRLKIKVRFTKSLQGLCEEQDEHDDVANQTPIYVQLLHGKTAAAIEAFLLAPGLLVFCLQLIINQKPATKNQKPLATVAASEPLRNGNYGSQYSVPWKHRNPDGRSMLRNRGSQQTDAL